MKHKYELGDVIFHPGADLNQATVKQGKIHAIIFHDTAGEVEVAYRTNEAFAVPEKDCFKTFKPAKKRLIEIVKEKGEEVKEEVKAVVKQIESSERDDILQVAGELIEHQTIDEETAE